MSQCSPSAFKNPPCFLYSAECEDEVDSLFLLTMEANCIGRTGVGGPVGVRGQVRGHGGGEKGTGVA